MRENRKGGERMKSRNVKRERKERKNKKKMNYSYTMPNILMKMEMDYVNMIC